MSDTQPSTSQATSGVDIVGAGPAGLIAAEILAQAGIPVTVHDQMPSVGRKFLMAGRGGLNLTHSEPLDMFLARYRPAAPLLLDAVRAFPPAALMAWCQGLGIETFQGSSGRIFPTTFKASPLLRAWLERLSTLGVAIQPRSRWLGWAEDGGAHFADAPAQPELGATILALGGASWPRLGSDGLWPQALPGVRVAPWAPCNMGFHVEWSEYFRSRHDGAPLKRIALQFEGNRVRGEARVTLRGIEGQAIYALSAQLREAIAARGPVEVLLDLCPDLLDREVAARLAARPRAESLSNGLRKALSLPPVAAGLIQEALRRSGGSIPHLVKALPIRVTAPAPLARAISSAGGLDWSELDSRFMLKARPGVFACGEMLDWEAPTGGYLLQACFSTGVAAAHGALRWIGEQHGVRPAPRRAASAP
ncbi:TIGR03862 family flavoprotein [Falsiroseomonas sp. HC035]|uniref:TIGR03862 family flavoprotein n=1 Tax=Falsiroseomonas sp. HC035 TaxID=3390999 RepID=UPI003D31ACE3